MKTKLRVLQRNQTRKSLFGLIWTAAHYKKFFCKYILYNETKGLHSDTLKIFFLVQCVLLLGTKRLLLISESFLIPNLYLNFCISSQIYLFKEEKSYFGDILACLSSEVPFCGKASVNVSAFWPLTKKIMVSPSNCLKAGLVSGAGRHVGPEWKQRFLCFFLRFPPCSHRWGLNLTLLPEKDN